MRRVQSWVLARVNSFLCIRSGDINVLAARFGVDSSRCRFAHFPPSFEGDESHAVDAARSPCRPYVYASGSARRDWKMLFEALTLVDHAAIVSAEACATQKLEVPARTTLTGHVSPEEGRALAADAVAVIVPLQDTDLPAGPTVLVDAMALGCPVIATDTNGTRDYVKHGVTGWLVPPGDARGLAETINALLADPARLEVVGRAAARECSDRFSAMQFAHVVAELCGVTGRF
jgi:glycosyltransferase involved in cell wall biosynthesis